MCPYQPGIAIPLAGAKAYMQSLRRVPTTICGALFKPDAQLQDFALCRCHGLCQKPLLDDVFVSCPHRRFAC